MRQLMFILAMLTICQNVKGQIKGQVVDTEDNYGIPYANVICTETNRSVNCDGEGYFTLQAYSGQHLRVSSMGYETQTVTVGQDSLLVIKMKYATQQLSEVQIKARRKRYKRKNNPAVELMRRVIAAKKENDLKNHDYYDYHKYQKLSFGSSTTDTLRHNRPDWWKRHLERSELTDTLIQTLSVSETLTHYIYRRNPQKTREYILGQRSTGVNDLIQTGEILTDMLKEIFTDVNLYDDHIRLLQYPFPSPIGRTAISFYHFYIIDTVRVENDSCYHLRFFPANQQDFGFTGDLYVMKDSTLHVRRCILNIPRKSDVNFVKDMRIEQEFSQLDNGEWVLSHDDLWARLVLVKPIPEVYVTRKTRLSDYAFEPLARKYYRGKATSIETPDSRIHDDEFWAANRQVELTHGEATMSDFISGMQHAKGFFWLQTFAKVFLENYAETSKPGKKSYIDLGPLNASISHNYIDKLRLRFSARTTAALNPHLFWKGYGAYGTHSHNWYYGQEVTYAFNKKQHSPFEFPMRNLVFSAEKDVMSAADKYLLNNKDNVFESFRTQTVRKMYFYDRQKLEFVYETDWGMQFKTSLKAEKVKVAGDLRFIPLVGNEVRSLRTTEWSATLDFLPGQTYVNTKQRRLPTNYDAPEFMLTHTIGFKHFLGGQYNMNLTQLRLYKRQWLGSWGAMEFNLNAGAEWNKVPFPLLIMPPVNLSYFMERDNETFNLMRNMEFLNDRYVYWNISWDMNGKFFNRIPLLKKLKWREYIAVKGMWGHLTSKNNPLKNPQDPMLFQFPEESHIMSNKPYWEVVVGVHNIFKFLAVNYVRRITYTDNPNIDKWGLRFAFLLSF